MDDNLQRAITLIKEGQKKEGGLLLAEIVKQQPKNESAWFWLSKCLKNSQQKMECLSKVLEINPQNDYVRKEIQRLQSEKEYQFADNLPPKKQSNDIGIFLAVFLFTIFVCVMLFWFFFGGS